MASRSAAARHSVVCSGTGSPAEAEPVSGRADLLRQRELAFANLKRKGVLVLDAPATQISDGLVDRYIQIKSINQL